MKRPSSFYPIGDKTIIRSALNMLIVKGEVFIFGGDHKLGLTLGALVQDDPHWRRGICFIFATTRSLRAGGGARLLRQRNKDLLMFYRKFN